MATTAGSASTFSFRNPNFNLRHPFAPLLPSLLRLPRRSPLSKRLRLRPSASAAGTAAALPVSTNPFSSLNTSFSTLLSFLAPLCEVSYANASRLLAALTNRGDEFLIPLMALRVGIAKWLEIYSGVLMVRVMLSWYPNIPWDRQPLSALRDLCDPFLNLFRKVTPQIFGAMDLSPILAFAVLGALTSILNTGHGIQ